MTLAALLPLLLSPLSPQAGGEPAEAELRARFRFADRNRNGWISLREAEEVFGLDRRAFGRFDADQDGRVPFEEFAPRCRAMVRAGAPLPGPSGSLGALAPIPGQASPLPPWLFPLDRGGKGRISLDAILARVGGSPSAHASIRLADRDGDRFLDLEEIALLGLAPSPSPASAPAPPPASAPASAPAPAAGRRGR